MSGKFALIIGNTEYADPGLAELTAPGRDAEDFARVLTAPEIAAFDRVFTLINKDVFLVNQAIEDFFTRKKPGDLLLLYFSGHGVRDENGLLYLAVTNTSRARLRSTAINSTFIRDAMDHSRSRRQVLILDCCNSGAFAQGTKSVLGGTMGTAKAFEGTGYGRVVLTASDATQFAWEGDKVIGETDNSLFTHFLVRGLEGEADHDADGRISVDELYDYAYGQIVSHTTYQTPGKWSYKQQGEIYLRESMALESIRPIALPADLLAATENTLPFIREGAVKQLEQLLKGKNQGLARSARMVLEKMAAEDDSRRIAQLAQRALEIADELQQTKAEFIEEFEKKENVLPERIGIAVPERRELDFQPVPVRQFTRTKTPETRIAKPSGPNAIPVIAGITLLFLFILGGWVVKTFVFPSTVETQTIPTEIRIFTLTPLDPTAIPVVISSTTPPVLTSTPTPTFTPTTTPTVTQFAPQEPDQFINYFFETIIYQRDYELAWSLLSERFRVTNNPNGFEDWKNKTWEPVVEWRQPIWTVNSISPTKAVVSCPEIWFRASQWYSLSNRQYCLVRDESRNTWIIEEKAVCGL